MQRTESCAAFSLGGMNDAQRTELWASLALRHTSRLGPRTWKKLLDVYPSPYTAVLDAANWGKRTDISSRVISEFRSERWRGPAKLEWEAAGAGGWRILLWTDARYPERLKEISDPPIFLYYVGDASLLSNPGVGVVGSRLCSRDGITTTRELCRRLSASGVTTVSGLARGIDSEAHKAALESWGSTIAVLGTGPDSVYPPENSALHERICSDGLVLTEFAPGTIPDAKNFPMRNRIISGLSLGVLVVEAAKRSGSLITARHALDQGREVFAVPGRVQARTSSGCHDLIRQGAKAVFSCDDVLVEIAPLIGINAHEWKTPEDVEPVRRNARSARTDRGGRGRGGNECHTEPELYADEVYAGGMDHSAHDDLITYGAGASGRLDQPVLAHGKDAAEQTMSSMPRTRTKEMREQASETTVSSASDRRPSSRERARVVVETDTMTPDEKMVYELLMKQETTHIDDMCRSLSWQASRISSILLMLEVQGAVRQLPGMHYSAIV